MPTNNTDTHCIEEGLLPEFDSYSSDDDSAHLAASLKNDSYHSSDESQNDAQESCGDTVFVDSTESPVESGYSCFTTSQKCVTSLM